MKIWTIKVGEPLPVHECDSRLYRTGLLSEMLSERGHDVTWWTSTFFHQEKRQLAGEDTCISLSDRLRVVMLHTPGYASNISVSRIIDHRVVAKKFADTARRTEKPDLIVCAFPTIGLSSAAVRYGVRAGIPTVIDIRDLWPDVFLHVLPENMRWAGIAATSGTRARVRNCLRQATALTAMSDGCLSWGLQHAGRVRSSWDGVFPLGYPEVDIDPTSVKLAGKALQAKGIDPRKTICWFVGMFGKHYDLGSVLEAAFEMENRGCTEVQFVLSGDGPAMAKLQTRAKGIRNVVFTDWIGPAEIAYMSQIAHVGLLPIDSVPESLPNRLFEYMAAGLPIVASLTGEGAHLLEQAKCGLTYSPGDVRGLCDALCVLVSDTDQRVQMAARSRCVFESGYSAQAVYGRMADHLEMLVDDVGLA